MIPKIIFEVDPNACPKCQGRGCLMSYGSGHQGTPPPGTPVSPSPIPIGAVFFWHLTVVCDSCRGSGRKTENQEHLPRVVRYGDTGR